MNRQRTDRRLGYAGGSGRGLPANGVATRSPAVAATSTVTVAVALGDALCTQVPAAVTVTAHAVGQAPASSTARAG